MLFIIFKNELLAMKNLLFTLALLTCFTLSSLAQYSVHLSNPNAAAVLSGNYSPSTYVASVVIEDPDIITQGIINDISTDSLQVFSDKLISFGTRHVLSDTVSNIRGIGAARRWIHDKFLEISVRNENRLEVGYLDFKKSAANTCPQFSILDHRNVVAVLPGTDNTDPSFLLVEAHMDSRCTGSCDTTCFAPGRDDNGSGTCLVIELARVLSKYSFEHTIVFTTTTGEELGLWGGEAWAFYIDSADLAFKACYNNDVVGNVLCGPVASPPSCTPPGSIDSTSVRIFSYSQSNNPAANSIHKQLARFTKLQLLEVINPLFTVPMDIDVYIYHDRTGRGGDHQPFSAKNLRALRFTESNEHGNGSGATGHLQHTVNDTLIDYNYLARNTIINGVNLALLALGPDAPTPVFTAISDGIQIEMTGVDTAYLNYRVAVRGTGSSSNQYWDSVYTFTGTKFLIINDLVFGETYYVSVMNVDADGVESLPSDEFTLLVNSINGAVNYYGILLHQNYPNPATESTTIQIDFKQTLSVSVELHIIDLGGRVVQMQKINPDKGIRTIQIDHRILSKGYYLYSLYVDGIPFTIRKMIFN